MNTKTYTINDEAAIRARIKVCQENLEMLSDFAPNHQAVVQNTNTILDLVEALEAIQQAK